ncbi:hypothetical protein H0H81_011828, partial [Sphagnurus paluster]
MSKTPKAPLTLLKYTSLFTAPPPFAQSAVRLGVAAAVLSSLALTTTMPARRSSRLPGTPSALVDTKGETMFNRVVVSNRKTPASGISTSTPIDPSGHATTASATIATKRKPPNHKGYVPLDEIQKNNTKPVDPANPTPWNHPEELPYICSDDWSQDLMLEHLCRASFSVPPHDNSTPVHLIQILPSCVNPGGAFTTVTASRAVYLPRGYRVPLMFIAKFQWESLRLVLTGTKPMEEWDEYKFDIMHLSRLCQHLFEQAQAAQKAALEGSSVVVNAKGSSRAETKGKLVFDRTWRSPTFDRMLTRFYHKWFVSREWSLKAFYEEFDEEEYEIDVLKYDWDRWAIKGHKGFMLTLKEIQNGITAETYVGGLRRRADGVWIWDSEAGAAVVPTPFMTDNTPLAATPMKTTTTTAKATTATADISPNNMIRGKHEHLDNAGANRTEIVPPFGTVTIMNQKRKAGDSGKSESMDEPVSKRAKTRAPSTMMDTPATSIGAADPKLLQLAPGMSPAPAQTSKPTTSIIPPSLVITRPMSITTPNPTSGVLPRFPSAHPPGLSNGKAMSTILRSIPLLSGPAEAAVVVYPTQVTAPAQAQVVADGPILGENMGLKDVVPMNVDKSLTPVVGVMSAQKVGDNGQAGAKCTINTSSLVDHVLIPQMAESGPEPTLKASENTGDDQAEDLMELGKPTEQPALTSNAIAETHIASSNADSKHPVGPLMPQGTCAKSTCTILFLRDLLALLHTPGWGGPCREAEITAEKGARHILGTQAHYTLLEREGAISTDEHLDILKHASAALVKVLLPFEGEELQSMIRLLDTQFQQQAKLLWKPEEWLLKDIEPYTKVLKEKGVQTLNTTSFSTGIQVDEINVTRSTEIKPRSLSWKDSQNFTQERNFGRVCIRPKYDQIQQEIQLEEDCTWILGPSSTRTPIFDAIVNEFRTLASNLRSSNQKYPKDLEPMCDLDRSEVEKLKDELKRLEDRRKNEIESITRKHQKEVEALCDSIRAMEEERAFAVELEKGKGKEREVLTDPESDEESDQQATDDELAFHDSEDVELLTH